jgi:galactokinase
VTAVELFRATYHREPEGAYSAPGRVNLIGEHTDYSGGLVLPFAIDARATVAAAHNNDSSVQVVSAQRPGAATTIDLVDLRPDSPGAAGWPAYLFGAVWALRDAGYLVGGMDLSLDSSVPAGAGLSSSAAVECATVLACADLTGIALGPLALAALAQRAENDFVGVPCGPMDQTASAAARAGAVLLFDTNTRTIEHIPFDLDAAGSVVLVLDTRVAHSLADGEYARRRSDCENAARQLGVAQLRDISVDALPAALDRVDSDELQRRIRHVVTENDRVLRTAQHLVRGRLQDIGPLLTASHVSLRDDYEVSCPELDAAVDAALAAGALGARMTGGGFGGSVIALLPVDRLQQITASVEKEFRIRGFRQPVARVVTPAQGAFRES